MTDRTWARFVDRDVVVVKGNDAESFLQGQLSQEVAGLASGTSAWSFLLAPDGKLGFWLRVTRLGEEAFALDADAGFGPGIVDRLGRFKLRVDCELTLLDDVRCLAVRGPDASSVDATVEGELVRAAVEWPGFSGVDVFAAEITVPASVPEVDAEAFEAARIASGFPGPAELVEGTIPAEVGVVATSVSFTKGCYVGQELVARIDSRGGNVPRHLRRLIVGDPVLPPPGAEIVLDGAPVGRLTSVAPASAAGTPAGGGPVALAFVARKVDPPAEVVVAWDGGEVSARVEALPLGS